MSGIRFDRVSVHFDSVRALQDVNLELPAGKVTAVVGESGCGKSTLLKTLNGLVPVTSGQIEVLGVDPSATDLVALRRRMGFAVQDAALFPHCNVFANISLLATLEAWPPEAIAKRVVELMELLELSEDLLHRYPHELSGGQHQRVSLGRAFMLNPELLLLDEPFSALDPITRASIHDWFRSLMAKQGKGALLVTHDMGEATYLGDYLVVLSAGRVAQAASVEEVRNAPASDHVARLLGKQPQ